MISVKRWSALAAAFAAFLGGSAFAQDADWQKVVDAAKKEGRVVVYLNTVPGLNDRIKADFEKAYPDIKVEMSRIIGAPIFTKIEQERESNSDGGDVIMNADFLGVVALGKKGTPRPPVGPAAKDWPAKYMYGQAFLIGAEPSVIVYNSDLYKQEITGYPDLLRPDLKGKVAVLDLSSVATVFAWYDWIERTQGPDYLPKLATQARSLANAVPNTQAVAAGEALVTPFTIMAIAKPIQAQGAPLKVVIPNPAFAGGYLAAALNWAKRPNAALVFIDYLMSVRGQTVVVGQGEMASPRTGIPGSLDITKMDIYDPAKYTTEYMKTYQVKWDGMFRASK